MKTVEIQVNDYVHTSGIKILHADWGFSDSDIPNDGLLYHLKSMLFKACYNLARPVVEMHGGDMFHDAMMINNALKPENANGFKFRYGVRQYGTHIDLKPNKPDYISQHNDYTYLITLTHDGKRWYVHSEMVNHHG